MLLGVWRSFLREKDYHIGLPLSISVLSQV
jgi:hypothetical protein